MPHGPSSATSGSPRPLGDDRPARLLIVDDQEANVLLLERILRREGYSLIVTSTDPTEALALFLEHQPDVVLLDLHMPVLDGQAVLGQLRGAMPPGEHVPVLVLTGDLSVSAKRAVLAAGAKDFLTKPFDVVEVVLRIRNLLETRFLHLHLQGQNEELEERVLARTRALDASQLEILARLGRAVEYRDDATGQHTERVGRIAAMLGEAFGLSERRVALLRRAAPLHDVGKLAIPDSVLLKPGKLTDEEFAVMKTHTVRGARILSRGRSRILRMAERIALAHHERWDGAGYPQGLGGEDIPLEARLTSVADVLDALSHDRPYRAAWPLRRALREIEECSGSQFDPSIVALMRGRGVKRRLARILANGRTDYES